MLVYRLWYRRELALTIHSRRGSTPIMARKAVDAYTFSCIQHRVKTVAKDMVFLNGGCEKRTQQSSFFATIIYMAEARPSFGLPSEGLGRATWFWKTAFCWKRSVLHTLKCRWLKR